METLTQLAEQMLTACQILQAVAAEGSGKRGEGAQRLRGEIRGRCLEIAGHKTGKGFVAAHQIPEASLGLEPAGLLEGGKPTLQGGRGGESGLSIAGTGSERQLRGWARVWARGWAQLWACWWAQRWAWWWAWWWRGPPQGIQEGGSGPGRIERMSCSHSASASCAWIRRWRRW